MDSTILASIIGGICTRIIGYFIGYNKKITQTQKAKNNGVQIQVGDINERE